MNPSQLTLTHFETRIDDARRRADAAALLARSARGRERRPADYAEHVVIRSGVASDDAEVARLAELDGGHVPAGATLVAELRGRVVAAISLDGGRAIADPFRPTGDIARLLELRASQLRDAARGSRDGDVHTLRHGAARGRPSGLLRLMRGGRHALGA
jgi:hypothetical protein